MPASTFAGSVTTDQKGKALEARDATPYQSSFCDTKQAINLHIFKSPNVYY